MLSSGIGSISTVENCLLDRNIEFWNYFFDANKIWDSVTIAAEIVSFGGLEATGMSESII